MKITKTSALTQARLKENLLYNKETGIFTWRDDSENRKKANFPKGKIAGSPNSDGYTQIIIDGVSHKAHRLAWLYVYGKFPKTGIDHIDQSKDNNAIKNLREADQALNNKNRRMGRNNTSGVIGVARAIGCNKWRARVSVGGKCIFLGNYDTKEEAALARKVAEKKYGFSETHGKTM